MNASLHNTVTGADGHRRELATLADGRPRFFLPPLRLKQFTGANAWRADALAGDRLASHGYQWDPAEALWHAEGGPDCVIKGGQVLALRPVSQNKQVS